MYPELAAWDIILHHLTNAGNIIYTAVGNSIYTTVGNVMKIYTTVGNVTKISSIIQ